MARTITRRTLLVDLGRTTLGAVVLGLAAACTSDDEVAGGGALGSEGIGGTAWHQVSLGSVSAYVLVRDGEAVVVDTGVSGSEDAIEETLAAAGSGWGDVGHVILTHRHPDHVGSLPAVLSAAADATAYAGAADIPNITAPRDITAVGDGDTVAGLTIVATPGHTAGHVSVLDEVAGLLATGDALNGGDGGVVGPNPRFTDDMDEAWASVATLGGLTYDIVVFGHGAPLVGDAAAAVGALERGA